MDSSLGTGFMAVFAVSGSVVFLAMQAHKRLLSNFMKEMEFEIKNSSGIMKDGSRKKVRFTGAVESTVGQKACLKKHVSRPASLSKNDCDENLEGMPENWQIMYKGILQYKNLRGCN
ncbi:hypothetical protein CDL12_18598 [Handroanthus impetiginosus]|uniref:Uncharacterized protein n=1 Tax=Handroanthus impetiginosus TaxID=429701 RepID=A0A2G9GU51_9LAMI|nr:hypothetical protein CDL12_18598 [Handroanthus impetiginosus]